MENKIFPGKEVNKDELFKEALYQFKMFKQFDDRYHDALLFAQQYRKKAVELLNIIEDNNYIDEFLLFCEDNKEGMGIKIG